MDHGLPAHPVVGKVVGSPTFPEKDPHEFADNLANRGVRARFTLVVNEIYNWTDVKSTTKTLQYFPDKTVNISHKHSTPA